MLAAIPSVIIGLWGLFVLVPFVRSPIESWLGSNLGFLPLFQGPPFGVGFLAAGIILAIMVIPIITAVSRDAIRAVPVQQREAMLALGATRWETISQAVLPYCRSGLVGAVILGLGRALGETMAVTMVIGNSYTLTASLFSPGATIASKIASEFSEASSGVFVGSLVELALILFAVTLLVNVVARLLVWRMTAVKAAKGISLCLNVVTCERKWFNRIMLGLCGVAAGLAILILALILGYTLAAWHLRSQSGLSYPGCQTGRRSRRRNAQ